MKRAQIRTEVAIQLAVKGWSQGWYGWERAWLVCHDKAGKVLARIHAGSGISRKRLLVALADIPTVGPMRQITYAGAGARDDRQYELERDYLGDSR